MADTAANDEASPNAEVTDALINVQPASEPQLSASNQASPSAEVMIASTNVQATLEPQPSVSVPSTETGSANLPENLLEARNQMQLSGEQPNDADAAQVALDELLKMQAEACKAYQSRIQTTPPRATVRHDSPMDQPTTPVEQSIYDAMNGPDGDNYNDAAEDNDIAAMRAKLRSLNRTMNRKDAEGILEPTAKIELIRQMKEVEDKISRAEFDASYTAGDQDSDDDDSEYDMPASGDDDEQVDPENDETLFIPEATPVEKRGRKRASNAKQTAKTQPPNKRKKKASKTARFEDEAEDVYEAEISDGERQHINKLSKKDEKTRARAKQNQGQVSGNMLNYDSLFSSNFVRDAHKNQDLPNQPIFNNTTRRNDALHQLLASLPKGQNSTARGDKKELEDALKYFPGNSVHPGRDGLWQVDGMKTALKPYQAMAVGFMRKQEMGTALPRGGILADEMGLGKTVTMLTNIILGQTPRRREFRGHRRATLVVVSASLTQQWYDEIHKHCHRFEQASRGYKEVMRHHSGFRNTLDGMEDKLGSADIVLTTYSEVSKNFPKYAPPAELVDQAQKDAWWKQHFEAKRGILFRVNWLRVVLDEAQAIKNHDSRISKACANIDARYRWAITGTPLYNNTQEVYPYFRFLREPYTSSFKIFKANFAEPEDPNGDSKLAILLRRVMIRRTHGDTLMGAKLLDLPLPKEREVLLEFTPRERAIYDVIRKRYIIRINALLQEDEDKSGKKQHRHIWTLLLRLRQICSHFSLVNEPLIDLIEHEDIQRLTRIDETSPTDMSGHLIQMVQLLASSKGFQHPTGVLETNASFRLGCPVAVDNFEGGSAFARTQSLKPFLDELRQPENLNRIEERTTCCSCSQRPTNPQITSCNHVYCYQCAVALCDAAAAQGQDQAQCLDCGVLFLGFDACEDAASIAATQNTEKPKDKKVMPSAKLIAVKAQILAWLFNSPDEKIIIYTQFISVIDMLAKMCLAEKWSFAKHTGHMSPSARTRAINDFGNERQILLATLHSGGLGLNLTMASRIIIIDPWWNEAVERQAFARVHRIGQTRQAQLVRFIVKDSLDEAMRKLKRHKQVAIDSLINDAKGPQLRDMKELLSMFGRVEEDADGKPFVVADDGDEVRSRLRVWELE